MDTLHTNFKRVVAAILLWTPFSTTYAVDVEVVNFESAVYPHSAFKLRQAKQKGVELEAKKGLIVSGRLTIPKGVGPFPAVVLLHGCDGIGAWNDAWMQRLTKWGYVVLEVDSLTPRSEGSICDSPSDVTVSSRSLDAHGAKNYLIALDVVDPAHIAVVGMSHGGTSVLSAVSTDNVSMFDAFQAAVAFYPWCDELKDINAPLLTLIGAKDDWTPASRCGETLPKANSDHEVDLKIYPDAYHWFDLEGIDQQLLGHTLRYDADATSDAVMKVQQFLETHLQ